VGSDRKVEKKKKKKKNVDDDDAAGKVVGSSERLEWVGRIRGTLWHLVSPDRSPPYPPGQWWWWSRRTSSGNEDATRTRDFRCSRTVGQYKEKAEWWRRWWTTGLEGWPWRTCGLSQDS